MCDPQLWRSHTDLCPPTKHSQPFPELLFCPMLWLPFQTLATGHCLIHEPSPIRQGGRPATFAARSWPTPPCRPSLGLTQLWCPALPQVFQPGTSVSASVGPHPKKIGLPANGLSLSLWPKLQPHSPETLSPFPSLARRLSATQDIKHSLGLLPVIFLHFPSTGVRSRYTPGIYCTSSR